MLLDKYLKTRATPAVESVDPAVVAAVQQDVVAEVDNATAIPEVVTPEPIVPVSDVPTESELPAPNTAAAVAVVSSDADAALVVVADTAPEVLNPAAVTVSVEDKETETAPEEGNAEEADSVAGDSDSKVEEAQETTEAPQASEEAPSEKVESTEEAAPEESAPEETSEAAPAPEATEGTDAKPDAAEAETPEVTETEQAPESTDSAESTETPEATKAAPEPDQAPADADATPESAESEPAPAEGESADATASEDNTEEITAAAAEEIDQDAAPVNQEELVAEVNEQEDEYANQMLELNGLQEKDSELRATVESLMARATALENFQAVLQSGLDAEEPISPEAAAIMGEVVSQQTEGLVEGSPIPAMESFMGRGGSLRSMSASLESTTTALDTVWRWIVAAIRRLIETGANLWRKFTEDSAKLMARAENLLELVHSIDNGAVKGDVNVTKMTLSRLSVEGKPVGRSLPDALENLHVVTDSIVFNVESDLATRAQTFIAGLSGIDLSDLNGTLPEIPSTHSVGAYFRKSTRTEDDKMDIMTNARPLPGHIKVNFMVPTPEVRKGPRLDYWVARTTISVLIEEGFDVAAPFSNDDSEYRMPLLSANEMEVSLEHILKTTKLINKYRSGAQRLDQIKQQMISAGTAFANKHAKETDEARQNAAKTIVRCVNEFAKDLGAGCSQIAVYSLRTCDHAMRYINACVQVHLAKTAEK